MFERFSRTFGAALDARSDVIALIDDIFDFDSITSISSPPRKSVKGSAAVRRNRNVGSKRVANTIEDLERRWKALEGALPDKDTSELIAIVLRIYARHSNAKRIVPEQNRRGLLLAHIMATSVLILARRDPPTQAESNSWAVALMIGNALWTDRFFVAISELIATEASRFWHHSPPFYEGRPDLPPAPKSLARKPQLQASDMDGEIPF